MNNLPYNQLPNVVSLRRYDKLNAYYIYQLKKLFKILPLLEFLELSNWSAPNANEHGLIPPAPIAINTNDENRNANWAMFGFWQFPNSNLQGCGLASLRIDVNQRTTNPYNQNNI